MRLEVHEATLADVMAQLSTLYGFTFQAFTPIDRSVNGNYSGRLRTILARLLENTNYVIRHTNGELSIAVYGQTKTPATSNLAAVPMPTPAATSTVAASQRRTIANPAGARDGGYIH